MGYRIEYGTGDATRKPVRTRKLSVRSLVAVISAAAFVITLSVPAGRKWLREAILPGDTEVTAAALTELLDDLRSGEEFGVAVETFCVQIISGE